MTLVSRYFLLSRLELNRSGRTLHRIRPRLRTHLACDIEFRIFDHLALGHEHSQIVLEPARADIRPGRCGRAAHPQVRLGHGVALLTVAGHGIAPGERRGFRLLADATAVLEVRTGKGDWLAVSGLDRDGPGRHVEALQRATRAVRNAEPRRIAAKDHRIPDRKPTAVVAKGVLPEPSVVPHELAGDHVEVLHLGPGLSNHAGVDSDGIPGPPGRHERIVGLLSGPGHRYPALRAEDLERRPMPSLAQERRDLLAPLGGLAAVLRQLGR